MTNDTTTLNGALTELGELMADNLNSMGVSDADASDGLTTLANKILDIAPVSQNLTLTSDKSVLSAYDSEYATLTATLSGGVVEGQTVSFDIVDSGTVVENIGTAQTNSSGVATVSYYAEGTGDISIQASVGMIVSETYSIEDCIKYNHLDINGWSTNNNPTVSTSDEGITISTSSNGEKRVYFAQAFTSSDNVEMSFVWVGGVSNAQCMGCAFLRTDNIDSEKFFSRSCPSQFAYKFKSSGSASYSQESLATGDTIKLQYVNGVCKAYKNDTLIASTTTSIYNFYFGFYTNSGRSQTIKDIEIKAL